MVVLVLKVGNEVGLSLALGDVSKQADPIVVRQLIDFVFITLGKEDIIGVISTILCIVSNASCVGSAGR